MDFEEGRADDEDTMNPEDVGDEETKEAKVNQIYLFFRTSIIETC